ncbi:hypothetical protein AB4Y45_35580 [Paraburkholderia sp. EG287A]|uniref:hypothetical protein n=1 Tax=Paraburkholderia sp. EG287A TaxID=3237012 RepID=UPI0034D2109B
MCATKASNPITTSVMAPDPARFNQVGQLLATTLHDVNESISQGLAKRLLHYAEERLDASGFRAAVTGWEVEVYTIDGNDVPSERSYCVRWKNAKGGYIEVVGILTNNGWPCVDHGFYMSEE